VETVIGAHLLNCSYADGYSVYYWRDGNYEVDFVLIYKGKVVALEVKSGYRERLAALEQFRRLYPEAKVYLIGKQGIRWEEFIMIDPLMLF
jgi:predicted AAA+ superfamily ATPase